MQARSISLSPRGSPWAARRLLWVAEHRGSCPKAIGRAWALLPADGAPELGCHGRRRKRPRCSISPAVRVLYPVCWGACRHEGSRIGGCPSGQAVVTARALKMPPQRLQALGSQTQRVGRVGKDLVHREGVNP